MADTPGTGKQDARSQYEASARSALDKLRTQLDELRVQADLAGAEARDKLQQGIETLRKRQGEARQRLDDAQSAGEGAWKSLASQAEQVVGDLGDAFGKLADEVQKAAGAGAAAASKGKDAFLEEWRKSRDERSKLVGD